MQKMLSLLVSLGNADAEIHGANNARSPSREKIIDDIRGTVAV